MKIDDIYTLNAAASRTEDRTLRKIYLAEARVLIEAIREELENANLLVKAAEGEVVRLEGLSK